MLHELASVAFRRLAGPPCFRVYGKGRQEQAFHVIDVFATHRRDADSRWPLFRGTCITWTASVIAVGWDFAEALVREQALFPASREHPVEVRGGCLRGAGLRLAEGAPAYPTVSEVMAHECGHTAQARRFGFLYWPVGAAFTLFREGDRWYNRFENGASTLGIFGGLVSGSICERLRALLQDPGPGRYS